MLKRVVNKIKKLSSYKLNIGVIFKKGLCFFLGFFLNVVSLFVVVSMDIKCKNFYVFWFLGV